MDQDDGTVGVGVGTASMGSEVLAGTDDFDEFVRAYRHALVRYATLISGSSAHGEDMVQDVLARIYPRWAELRGRSGDIQAYLRRSLTNEYLSFLRRWSTRRIVLVDDEVLHRVPGREHEPDGPDPELWARLLRLPARQRTALVLRYYEALSDAEIAATMGCRQPTVRAHVSRGLAALRAQADEIRREVT